MAFNLRSRHFLKLLDYSSQEIEFLLDLSREIKKANYLGTELKSLEGKIFALIFEKTSTRTRCAFEVAAYDQGAHVTYIGSGSQMGHKESVKDTARVLGRMYDGIQYRGFGQEIVEELAEYAGVPVWNGLTNEWHPTQVLADLLTINEHTYKTLPHQKICYLGDGRNNVANSLLVGCAKMGMDFRIAAPKKCHSSSKLLKICKEISVETGAKLMLTEDIDAAIKNVDFLYTDVWVSMGEPEHVWEDRIKLLKPYQINAELVEKTKNPRVKILHCLPSFHTSETEVGKKIKDKYGLEGMEITDEIFESHNSIVFDQSENRVHTIKAIMVATVA
ncbi:ornithine carbamoyltransferase [Candidatus Riflebacteria bacterium]